MFKIIITSFFLIFSVIISFILFGVNNSDTFNGAFNYNKKIFLQHISTLPDISERSFYTEEQFKKIKYKKLISVAFFKDGINYNDKNNYNYFYLIQDENNYFYKSSNLLFQKLKNKNLDIDKIVINEDKDVEKSDALFKKDIIKNIMLYSNDKFIDKINISKVSLFSKPFLIITIFFSMFLSILLLVLIKRLREKQNKNNYFFNIFLYLIFSSILLSILLIYSIIYELDKKSKENKTILNDINSVEIINNQKNLESMLSKKNISYQKLILNDLNTDIKNIPFSNVWIFYQNNKILNLAYPNIMLGQSQFFKNKNINQKPNITEKMLNGEIGFSNQKKYLLFMSIFIGLISLIVYFVIIKNKIKKEYKKYFSDDSIKTRKVLKEKNVLLGNKIKSSKKIYKNKIL